jgi:hypothetical protein
MSSILKITAGILLAGVVLVVGCGALVAGGMEDVENQSDATAITVEQYTAAKTGETTIDELRADLGEPASQDDIATEDLDGFPDSGFEQECIYYGRKGDFLSLFQFCADADGVLTSKGQY